MPAVAVPRVQPHPDVLLVVGLIVVGYVDRADPARAAARARRRAGGHAVPDHVLRARGVRDLLASAWPIHDLAEGYLYSVHMVQHLTYTMVAAPLLLLGTPAWLARWVLTPRWLFRSVRWLSRFVPAIVIRSTS